MKRLVPIALLTALSVSLVHGHKAKPPLDEQKRAKALLLKVKKAQAAGRHEEAILQARKVLRLSIQDREPWDLGHTVMPLIARSACKLKKPELARWAASSLVYLEDERQAVVAACKAAGVKLDRPPPPFKLRKGDRACTSGKDCVSVSTRGVCSRGYGVVNRRAARRLARRRAKRPPGPSCRKYAQPDCDEGKCSHGRYEDEVCHPPSGLVACVPEVMGSTPVQVVILPGLERLAECRPPGPGQIDVKFTLTGRDGRVILIKVVGQPTGAWNRKCLLSIIRGWSFPYPKSRAGISIVTLRLLSTR